MFIVRGPLRTPERMRLAERASALFSSDSHETAALPKETQLCILLQLNPTHGLIGASMEVSTVSFFKFHCVFAIQHLPYEAGRNFSFFFVLFFKKEKDLQITN